jgi:hypothetical protein
VLGESGLSSARKWTRYRDISVQEGVLFFPLRPGLNLKGTLPTARSPSLISIVQPAYGLAAQCIRSLITNVAEPEAGRRQRGSMSSAARPDGAAALLVGGPVRACRARREVDGRRCFVGKGQFTADARAVVVTVGGVLDHFAQQGASGHGMVFAQDRCHAS